MPVTFFNPTAPAGLVDEMWEIQTANPSTTKERAQALKSDGDEAASLLYGERTTLAVTAKCTKAEATLVLPSVGTVVDGYHIDSVTLRYSVSDWPTIELSCHKHAKGDTSHSGTHRTYSLPSNIASTLKCAIGVPAGAAGLTSGNLTEGITSLTIALTANHVEAPFVGSPPMVPASDNHDGTVTVTCETVGRTPPTIAEGISYDHTETSSNTSNTSNDDASHTLILHLAHD